MRGADLVGVAFEREGVVDAVAGAKRAIGRGICVDRAAGKAHRAKSVIAAQRVGGHRGQEDLLAAIGAAIHQHDRLAPDDLAVLGDRRPDPDIGVLAAEAGQHLLLPRIDKPDRTARLARAGALRRARSPNRI